MFGSQERRRREDFAAWTKKNADDHRRETKEGVRNASGSRHQKSDQDFIRGWKPSRDADQEYLDREAREAAKSAKRWWRS